MCVNGLWIVLMVAMIGCAVASPPVTPASNRKAKSDIIRMLNSKKVLSYTKVSEAINNSKNCEMQMKRLILKRGEAWKSLPLFEIAANDKAARKVVRLARWSCF